MPIPNDSQEKPIITTSRYTKRRQRNVSLYQRFINSCGQNEKKIFRIAGIIGLIVSIYFLVGAVYCFSQNSTVLDDDAYSPTWNLHVDKDSHAIVFKSGGNWMMTDMGSLKIEVTGIGDSEGIFIGTARPDDAERYLDGISYDEVTGLRLYPTRAIYKSVPGGSPVSQPELQDFWKNTVSGDGTNLLQWSPGSDNTLVVMNADGTPGLDLDMVIWTSTSYQFLSGMGNLTIGGFIFLLSLMAVLYSRKSSNTVYPVPLGMLPEKKKRGYFGKTR